MKWVPPELGKVKINVDASIFQGSSCFAIGMVARNQSGAFIGGRTMKFSRVASVLEAELIGIEETLSWDMSNGERDVLIEFDSLLAVQAIYGSCRLVIPLKLVELN